MKFIHFPTFALSFSLFATACSPGDASLSETKEAIDGNSNLGKLGIRETPSFAQIQAMKSIRNPTLPWTDTYWPLTEKSLARRWTKGDQKLGLAQYFESHAAAAKESKVDPMLSPADKYDILYRWRHGKALDAAKNTEFLKSFVDIENKLDLSAELSVTRGHIKDAFAQLGSNDLQEFRQNFPLSSDGWNAYLSYAANDNYSLMSIPDSGEDWSWMGLCHGWAPAALMEETPKHAVLVKFDEQEVLVTEGDMRGLLTKAWSDHSPADEQFFMGRRCNENMAEVEGKIPHGEGGKGYYGEITRGDAKQGFYVRNEMYLPYLSPSQRLYAVNYGDTDAVQGYMLETYSRNGTRFVLAKDLESAKKYVLNGDNTVVEALPRVKMFGCWDVNPASYHVALMEKIGKEGTGLVMDRTRTGQVWNQPVYGADFEIGPLKPIWEVPLSNKRAVGTKFVATVKTTVKWVSEPAVPRMAYTKEFDEQHTEQSVYTYVLEFDRNQKLIGGEWGTLDNTDPAQVTPDFIYGFTKGSKPADQLATGFDYTGIIQAIHACSLTAETDGEYEVAGKKYKYKTCELTKANAGVQP